MKIGVPKEIKTNENRIALVPAGAAVSARSLRPGFEGVTHIGSERRHWSRATAPVRNGQRQATQELA